MTDSAPSPRRPRTGPAGAFSHGAVPPEEINLGDIVLRRWQPGDTAARYTAITASHRELHPWMSWAQHPTTWVEQRSFGERAAMSWPDPNGACALGVFSRAGEVVAAIALEDRLEPRALEIGYWCHSKHTGQGIVTRAVASLTDVALALPGIERVEIHCDTANLRSAAIPRRLGYRLDRIEARPIAAPAEAGQAMIWMKNAAAQR